MKKEFDYNSKYLLRNGRPWFPVMGEMHYSRYRESCWEESLRKMKAGGLHIISTYVIWIHHEEENNNFDFTGCRNLLQFIKLCKKVGVEVFLRLGPWVHGEVRNGGFPDWLQNKEAEGLRLRSDDAEYLLFVRRFWEQVYAQVKGLLYEDGGPIIGIQIENEYGHVGGLQGMEGETHMRTLTAMAKEIGFRVPIYTATGWGGACIGDLLPVMGGYCEAPWDQRTCELEPNANYVFSHVRNDALIACDHHVEGAVTFDESRFPFLTAELGGGLQVTAARRPVAWGKDIGAMSVVKLGSGVALLGYYMYHGGSNPVGKLSTLQESRETGYLNDLPEINYDFNAPIRQFGTISDSYREIRLLSYFLNDYGDDFAPLEAEIFPEYVKPEDCTTLRLSNRHDKEHGYLFFNNYQRRRKMKEHKQVRLTGICDAGNVEFPAFDIQEGAYGFFPYRMKIKDALLLSALATPLCRLHTAEGDISVFYGDCEPCFRWVNGIKAEVLHLSRNDALRACKISLDQDYLILSDNFVWEKDEKIIVTGGKHTAIQCYPLPTMEIPGFTLSGKDGRFYTFERNITQHTIRAEMKELSADKEKTIYEISISYSEEKLWSGGRDVLLWFTFGGNKMEVFLGDQKINDYFYTGQEVPLSLLHFDFPQKVRVVVHSLYESDDIFLEKHPVFENGSACSLYNLRTEELYW